MFRAHQVKERLETAMALDEGLLRNVASVLPVAIEPPPSALGTSEPFDRLVRIVEQVHPGFLYLAWRSADGRHHCSIAMEEQELDRHAWLGNGATHGLALAAALVASVSLPNVRPLSS